MAYTAAYTAAYTVRHSLRYTLNESSTAPYGSAAAGAPNSDSERPPHHDDRVEDLGDQVIVLAGHMYASKFHFLEALARFDGTRGWEPAGHRSLACWLAYRAGLDAGTAREYVRVARALGELPQTSEAMSRGELSYCQARALTRVAKPDTESDLLELAVGCTTGQLERVVRAYRLGSKQDEAERDRERHESRTFSVFADVDGMYVLKGRLEPEVAAVVMRAVDAASDALYRKRSPAQRLDAERDAARRRADAIGLVAERALAGGFGKDTDDEVPISGTRAERYQVLLHVQPETLEADGEPGAEAGDSHLEDGTRVSYETSRRLSCDASLVRVTRSEEGEVLDVGRRTRTIPPALRRALEVRDRGCRFPGCGLRFTDAHHIVHWADGGETSLENTVLLCRYHHRLMHEGGWAVEYWGKGRAAFRDPRGSLHYEGGWQSGRSSSGRVCSGKNGGPRSDPPSVDDLIETNRARGADPGPWTPSARWKWEDDIPPEILGRAREALL